MVTIAIFCNLITNSIAPQIVILHQKRSFLSIDFLLRPKIYSRSMRLLLLKDVDSIRKSLVLKLT